MLPDIGLQEMLLIAVVLLLVVGPKELPRALQTVFRLMQKARSVTRDFQRNIEDLARETGIDDIKRDLKDLKNAAAIDDDIKQDFTNMKTAAAIEGDVAGDQAVKDALAAAQAQADKVDADHLKSDPAGGNTIGTATPDSAVETPRPEPVKPQTAGTAPTPDAGKTSA